VLLALLWPDPCDSLCPVAFKEAARERLRDVPGGNPGTTDKELRQALLRFIADFANWDNAAQGTYLEVSHALVKAAHAREDGGANEPPLVVDPFAGGGSIPVEALRVGCETFASDLNPVACLILKVMLEDIPRHGQELAEELRQVGAEIRCEAEKQLSDLYPKDPDGATPIACLWARTVRCEAPNCGAEIPLVRSFWLCQKTSRKRALRYRVERPRGQPPRVEFEVFEPKTEKEVPGGTVTRAKATCVCCGIVLPPERVRAQLTRQRGGAEVDFAANGERIGGARLLAVVRPGPKETGRKYRLPTERDYETVLKAQARVAKLLEAWERRGKQEICPVPNEPLPLMSGTFNVPIYGMNQWGQLFTRRQQAAIGILVTLFQGKKNDRISPALREILALSLGKLLRHCNVVSKWHRGSETVAGAFGMQALPMSWDFPEMFPLVSYAGGLEDALSDVVEPIETLLRAISRTGQVESADATEYPLPDESAAVWFTDPPYYFAIPYADLSDFFLVWLRRVLPGHPLLVDRFEPANPLAHKKRELCEMAHWDPVRYAHKDQSYFERGMKAAFAEGRRILKQDGIGCVVFAHKTTEGWEALLSGLQGGGWTITGSWPIATERGARLRARESAALATSVHLICRPRVDSAGVGDWADVLRELPPRVAAWMERMQSEGVRGADLVFACIGPALEIFSRFSKVETAEGREVRLEEYLAKVWEVVGRTALAQVLGTAEARARNGAAGAVEEDARLTALFLWTLQSTEGETDEDTGGEEENEDAAEDDEDEGGGPRSKTKHFTLVFDVVRRFAQPLGIDLPKWEGRVIETKKGVVRLLPVGERAKQLFGEDGAGVVASRLERTAALGPDPLQGMLFPETEDTPKVRGGRGRGRRAAVDVSDEGLAAAREATTLDRVHAAMLLQAGGRTNALRALLKAEQERGPDFLRLANALSALYPKESEEKRLLDAMLLAAPR
jgi:adenine-specific DNA methylase